MFILVYVMLAVLIISTIFLKRWFAYQSHPLVVAAAAGEKALSDLYDRESCIQNMRTRRAQVLKKHNYSMLRECEKGCQEAIESDWTDIMFAFYGYYGERTTNYARISLQV